MNALWLLNALLDTQVNKEAVGKARLSSKNDVWELLGYPVEKDIEPGVYMYACSDSLNDSQFEYLESGADAIVWTDEPSKDGSDAPMCYLLFRIDGM